MKTVAFSITQANNYQVINGSLSTSDYYNNGCYYDFYSFSASAGQQVAMLLQSNNFDAYLFLADSNGNLLIDDDDSGGGTNARIPPSGYYSIPSTGTYYILVSSYWQYETGAYTLSYWGPGSISAYNQSFSAQMIQTFNNNVIGKIKPQKQSSRTKDIPNFSLPKKEQQ